MTEHEVKQWNDEAAFAVRAAKNALKEVENATATDVARIAAAILSRRRINA